MSVISIPEIRKLGVTAVKDETTPKVTQVVHTGASGKAGFYLG